MEKSHFFNEQEFEQILKQIRLAFRHIDAIGDKYHRQKIDRDLVIIYRLLNKIPLESI